MYQWINQWTSHSIDEVSQSVSVTSNHKKCCSLWDKFCLKFVLSQSSVAMLSALCLCYCWFQGKGKWKLWEFDLSSVPPIPRDIPANQIIVQTVETIRSIALILQLVVHHKPVMFVGPTGTGKSNYITVNGCIDCNIV